MKQGIFGTWFKELATLVLTQTVQAFLLAIVMGIVISAMAEATSSESGTNYAAGMLAIIALSQFGKIENLVKKIFGISSQFGGDMDSGRGAFTAGKALALHAGRNLLDNGRKVIGGASKNLQARSQLKTLREQRGQAAMLDAQDEANALQEQENEQMLDQQAQDRISNNNLSYNKAALNDVHNAMGLNDGNAVGAAVGGMVAGSVATNTSNGNATTVVGSLGMDPGQFATLLGAITNNTTAIQANHNKPSSSTNPSKNENPIRKRTDAIDEKIAAVEKIKKDSGKEFISGIAETATAVPGAAIGATVGLGLGDKAADFALTGAGFGDTVGRKAVEAGYGAKDTYVEVRDNRKARANAKTEVVNTINQTIQNVQNTSIANAKKEAKILGKNLSQQELKKIGEEAAKNTYEKLKNDLSKGRTGSKNNAGTAYDDLGKNINPVKAVKGKIEKGKVDKRMNKGTKGITDISNL